MSPMHKQPGFASERLRAAALDRVAAAAYLRLADRASSVAEREDYVWLAQDARAAAEANERAAMRRGRFQ